MPARTMSSKGKAMPPKKGSTTTAAKDMNGETPKTNGTEATENGINGVDDVEMSDEVIGKAKDGEDEMTVVVPPPNSSKLSAPPEKDNEGDTTMNDGKQADGSGISEEIVIDPKEKAAAGKDCISVVFTDC